MDESSAATQITPGAIARSRFGSAPTPSGKRLATMTKNSNAVATSLRRRKASSRSRRTTQSAASSMQLDYARRRGAGFLVRGEDHRAAARGMAGDQRVDCRARLRVERGVRLVEQPERHRFAHHQARERGAAALTLREFANRNIRRNAEA